MAPIPRPRPRPPAWLLVATALVACRGTGELGGKGRGESAARDGGSDEAAARRAEEAGETGGGDGGGETTDAGDGEAEAEAAAPTPQREKGDGFRSFRAGRYRTGRANGRVPRAPVLRWEHTVGGEIRAQPVIAPDGTIVVASLGGTIAGVGPGGERKWTFEPGDRIYSTPFIDGDGIIYVGADTDSLYALGPGGMPKWTILPAEDTEKPELHDVDTAPIVRGDVGFVGAGLYVYAFDVRGTVRWRTVLGNKVFSSPALLPDGTVVVGSQDDKVWALRPAGAVRWTYETAADVDGTPAVDELRETIYVGGDDGKVHAISFGGKRRWTVDAGGFVRSGVGVDAEGRVYVTTFGPVARLMAIDGEGGWVRWTVDAGTGPTAEYGIRSSPVVDPEGVVLFGAPGGFVRAVSSEGEELWTFRVPDDVDSGPILGDDGTVYFGCDDGVLRAIGDPASG
ncbi:MAG: PQQ-binding-like beta-propeller repeat protein [Deltaproteobacteria bacterium]|nr:PQQ-binding-like beta-propeller repeat protein [Deltaproteobacteria bacterium]